MRWVDFRERVDAFPMECATLRFNQLMSLFIMNQSAFKSYTLENDINIFQVIRRVKAISDFFS